MNPLDFMDTSEERYQFRRRLFERDGKRFPRLRHWLLWILHNNIVHPILGLFPSERLVRWHKVTSQWLNHRPRYTTVAKWEIPKVNKRLPWLIHNILSHSLIGLFPFGWAFRWHDSTAEKMGIPDWV